MSQIGPDLILKLTSPDAFTATSIAFRTARLHHEASYHPMEDLVIIVAILRVRCEVLDRKGTLLPVQLQVDLSH